MIEFALQAYARCDRCGRLNGPELEDGWTIYVGPDLALLDMAAGIAMHIQTEVVWRGSRQHLCGACTAELSGGVDRRGNLTELLAKILLAADRELAYFREHHPRSNPTRGIDTSALPPAAPARGPEGFTAVPVEDQGNAEKCDG